MSIGIIASIAILAWIFLGWQIAFAALLAIPVFIIAYALSDKIATSRRDKYIYSEWNVFCKKIGWSWSAALLAYAISYIIIAVYYGDPMNIIPK